MYLFEDAMRALQEMKWTIAKFESRNKASEGNRIAFNLCEMVGKEISDPIDVMEIM